MRPVPVAIRELCSPVPGRREPVSRSYALAAGIGAGVATLPLDSDR